VIRISQHYLKGVTGHSRWDESVFSPKYRPKRGSRVDENSNLTEDIIFVIGTTLVQIKGPVEVQSSGIELNTGERSDIISSWCRAAVEHALAKANNLMLIKCLF